MNAIIVYYVWMRTGVLALVFMLHHITGMVFLFMALGDYNI